MKAYVIWGYILGWLNIAVGFGDVFWGLWHWQMALIGVAAILLGAKVVAVAAREASVEHK